MNDEEILALDELTGLVHDYKGTSPGGIGHDRNEFGIGIIPCGCDGFKEAAESNSLKVINRRHLERGIWEPAECLQEVDDE